MTTRWADGFEEMASGIANFQTDYTANAGTGLNVGTGRRTGTQCLSTVNGSLSRAIGGTEATMFQSIAVNPSLQNGSIMKFYEGATLHVDIRLKSTGALEAYRNTTLLGASSVFLTGGSWSWFQVKVVIHDSTGSVEIRDASGNVLLNLTGQDTRNGGTGYCDTVQIQGAGSSTYLFDDWHVWDTVVTGGADEATTWTNDTRVDHKFPDGAGNSAQFTPSTGSNYSCVDEANWNSTDYVESATAGHKDSYSFGDISHSPPKIFAVLRTVLAQKDDAGSRSIKPMTRRSGTDYSGSAVTLNQGSYVRVVDVQATDPSTSASWSQAGFNAAEFGFENV